MSKKEPVSNVVIAIDGALTHLQECMETLQQKTEGQSFTTLLSIYASISDKAMEATDILLQLTSLKQKYTKGRNMDSDILSIEIVKDLKDCIDSYKTVTSVFKERLNALRTLVSAEKEIWKENNLKNPIKSS